MQLYVQWYFSISLCKNVAEVVFTLAGVVCGPVQGGSSFSFTSLFIYYRLILHLQLTSKAAVPPNELFAKCMSISIWSSDSFLMLGHTISPQSKTDLTSSFPLYQVRSHWPKSKWQKILDRCRGLVYLARLNLLRSFVPLLSDWHTQQTTRLFSPTNGVESSQHQHTQQEHLIRVTTMAGG